MKEQTDNFFTGPVFIVSFPLLAYDDEGEVPNNLYPTHTFVQVVHGDGDVERLQWR